MKKKNNVRKWRNSFLRDLWFINGQRLTAIERFGLSVLKIVVLTIEKFRKDNIPIRASALTYFTLMSIVPFIALLFAIAKGFGLDNYLANLLNEHFVNQQETLNLLLDFSKRLLNNAKGGIIVGVGLAFLFWSVMSLLGSIEATFNNIWGLTTNRSYLRKFTDYFSVLLVAPIFLILANSLIIFLSSTLTGTFYIFLSPKLAALVQSLLSYLPYILLSLLFTFLYMVLPYTKVKFKSAVIPAFFAALGYDFVLRFYIYSQVTVSTYSAIYGSFAALPLFLLLVQIGWIIILFGAELSHVIQNFSQFEQNFRKVILSQRHQQYLAIVAMYHISKQFVERQPYLTDRELITKMKITKPILNEILSLLLKIQLIHKIYNEQFEEQGYLPSADVHQITAYDIVYKLTTYQPSSIDLLPYHDLTVLTKLFDNIDLQLQTSAINQPILSLNF